MHYEAYVMYYVRYVMHYEAYVMELCNREIARDASHVGGTVKCSCGGRRGHTIHFATGACASGGVCSYV